MGRAQGGPFLPQIRGSPRGQTQHRPSLCKTCPTTGCTCTVRGCTWSQRTRLWNGPLRTVGSRRLNRANRKETDPRAFCCKPCLAWEGVWARLTSWAPGLSAELGQGAPGRESPGPALCPPPPGPLCSVCVNRFGCRPVMLAGGLLASLGMVAASFCGSIIQLYLTTGVITGEWGPAGSGAGHGTLTPQWPGNGPGGASRARGLLGGGGSGLPPTPGASLSLVPRLSLPAR